jgi:DNA polymerase-3 subunit chi
VTTVAFHFNAPDRLGYTCRLLRKAVTAGAHVAVTGTAGELAQLDRDLWALTDTDFVPHCGADAPLQFARRSPVLLTEEVLVDVAREVLVNLGESVPENFEQFERVIEVVGLEPQERRAARLRWKHYQNLNLQLIQYDVAQPKTPS